MAKKDTSSGSTPAIIALEQAGVAHTVHAYEYDPAAGLNYGTAAATALDVDPARVFKTLCVDAGGTLAIGVVPVSTTLDPKAMASALGIKKVGMASPVNAQRATGYVVGGISPLGQRGMLPTIIDESALDFETVYVSGGKRGLNIEVAPADLVALTHAQTARIAKAS